MTPLERLAFDLYQVAGTENPGKIQARFLALLDGHAGVKRVAEMEAILAEVVVNTRTRTVVDNYGKAFTREDRTIGKRLLDRCRAALRGEG